MPTYNIELYGTITRDIRWVEVDAADEAEARRTCAHERPYYSINSVILASGNSDGTTSAPADGSPENPTS